MQYRLKNRGFTITELLVVIAVIGILATTVMVSLSTVRAKGRDAERRSDLRQLQLALTYYYDSFNQYPSTGGAWYTSAAGDQGLSENNGAYIPGLAPTYITSLPEEPLGGASTLAGCSGAQRSYRYRSDGTSYKLIANCAPEQASWTSNDDLYDPVRATTAWMVCSGATACSTW